MADTDNPFAKFTTPAPAGAPAAPISAAPAGDNPFAKFGPKKEEEGKKPTAGEYALDAAKAGPVGLAQGAIAIPGMPGDIQNLAQAGADKLSGYMPNVSTPSWLKTGYEAVNHFFDPNNKNAATMNSPLMQASHGDMPVGIKYPSSADIQHSIEGVTGPFYQAQHGPGKALQTAGQIAPALLTGGEGVAGALAKAGAGGVTSELAGEGANAAKGILPTAAQPWAEPVARAIGTIPGMAAPSLARRAVTPLPMTDARLSMVQALNKTNPELVNASTAGQLTESPRIAELEARSPRMADLPENQNAAYTKGVMRQAGSNGMFDTAGLAQAAQSGEDLRLLQNAHNMSPTEFAALNKDVNAMGRPGSQLYRAVGPSQAFKDVQDLIKLGPSAGTPKFIPPLDMTGQRYGALKQMIQNAGEAAPTTHESQAIFDARERMKQAFQNSIPPADADKLKGLDQAYSNYKTIENIPVKPGENTITPQQVSSKAKRGSDLDTHAEQASQVMKPLPKPNTEGGYGTKMLGAVLGGIAGGGAGKLLGGWPSAAAEGTFGSYYGMNHLNDVVQALKNGAGRVTANPVAQNYLKNQAWRPGPNSQPISADNLVRLLATPPVKQLGPADNSR